MSCPAYADDLVIVARSKAALQLLLDAASDAAHIVGLSFCLDKCASLSFTSIKQRATFVHQQDFLIQGNHIPALAQEQSYHYLGVPIGLVHNIDDLPSIVLQLTRHVELIGYSFLAPWQKLDAICTFVQLCLTYALRAGNPEMQFLDIYKSTLVLVLHDVCSLRIVQRPLISSPLNEQVVWLFRNRELSVTFRPLFRPSFRLCAFCHLLIPLLLPWLGKD